MTLPEPVTSDLRFSSRVDYFATAEEAETFATAKREAGYNVNGGAAITYDEDRRIPVGQHYERLFGVHWIDRKGEGWFG